MNKRIFTMCLSIMMLLTLFTPLTVFANSSTGRLDIIDNADFFTSEQEEELEDYIDSLYYSKLNMDVVVLTEPFDPADEVSYSDDYYDNNGYGKDGILFFVSDGVCYLSTIGYSQVAINDEEIDAVIDAGWDEFEVYDFYGCVYDMVGKASEYIEFAYENGYVDYKVDTDIVPEVEHVHNAPAEVPMGEKLLKACIPTIPSVLLSIAITAIVLLILVMKHKRTSHTLNAKAYLSDNFHVTNMNTRYMGTRETVQRDYYKPSSSSSSGSSSRSSSHRSGSSHRSSSGRSHGGGGRRR